jgi:LuxR family transcriptional regulator, maltose regulon positive regulatory protein
MEHTTETFPATPSRSGDRFPFTKFLPPVLDARVVTDRLVAQLAAAVEQRPLTLLIAPAGSGKTTALAAWMRATTDDALWVRVDPEDDEPVVLAAALLEGGRRQLGSGFGARLGQLLSYAGATPTIRQLTTSFVNDLGDHGRVAIVLDDGHTLEQRTTWSFLDDLLDHLPADARLVVGSREEPTLSLPRRRVRGQVAELGLDDLRLDRSEVRRVLAHEGAVTEEQIEQMLTATEGWAAAVRLATTHVGADLDAAVPSRVAATDVATDLRPFLATEVLGALPDHLRTFMLETAVLDELTAAVCDVVTQRDDSERLLEELDRRNLFVTRHRDGAEETWRSHDLFAAFLREQLVANRDPAELAELHRRASRCLPPLRALPHLLAAGEHAAAAELIVGVGLSDLDGGTQLHLAPAIRALPRAIRDADHRLVLLQASVPLLTGDARAGVELLEPLRDRLLASGDVVAAAEVNGSLAAAYLQLGDLEPAGAALEQALCHTGAVWHRPSTLAVATWWCFYRNDWEGVSRYNEDAVDLAFASGDPNLAKAVGSALSPQLLFVDRGPGWVADTVDRIRTCLSDDDRASSTALAPVGAGARLLRLEVDQAEAELRRCLDESAGFGQLAWTHQEAECLLANLCLGTGDLATVHRIVDDAWPRLDEPVYRQYRHLYLHAALRAHWLAGDHRRLVELHARTLAAQALGEQAEERVVRAVATAMVARIDGDVDAALRALRDGEQAQHEGRAWLWNGMPGLDRAGLLLELGREVAAIEAALPTLDVAAQAGAGLLFADARANRAVFRHCREAGVHTDLLRAVLAASAPDGATRGPVTIPGTDEALSRRELEVLTRVADGASNRDVAAALFISEATVKSHLTRILRKLQASSRTHAVARARELRLL